MSYNVHSNHQRTMLSLPRTNFWTTRPIRQLHFSPRTLTRLPVRQRLRAADIPDLDIPEVEGTVEYYQQSLSAEFDNAGRVLSFPDAFHSLSASNVLLYDRNRWGRFRIEGKGTLEFLHNKTTQSFKERRKRQGCDAVFCTAKGKILDLVTVYVQNQAAFIVLSPERQDTLLPDLQKFVFPGDEVTFVDVRDRTRVFSLYGEAAEKLMERLNVDESILTGEYGSHGVSGFMGSPVIVAKGNEIDRLNGYTLIVDETVAGDMYKNLLDAGALPIGDDEWNALRIVHGRPGEIELQSVRNPFEVDLFHAISLDKGCFMGQESIGRVYTRNTIRKHLWGIQLPTADQPLPNGSLVFASEAEIGFVTSSARNPKGEGSLALALLKTKIDKETVDWEGNHVTVDGHLGIVERRPYMTFDFPNGIGAPPSSSPVVPDPVDTKEAKLKAMQARLDAFMKNQSSQ